MLIEDINPIIVFLGPIAIRWYGLMMAVSFILGGYYFVKNGTRQGLPEETLLTIVLVVLIGGIVGARAVYVLTNLPAYLNNPLEMVRIDRGGLSFHGGLLGGLLAARLYAGHCRLDLRRAMDLAVPGIAIGYMLVRIANIFNQEILGRPAELFFFERHPAQLYGSLIGLFSLLLHNYLARKHPGPPGMLFWAFIFYYSLLRGALEETFRANPLVLWGYINDAWGAGFFTMTQVATPFILLLAWWMMMQEAGGKRLRAHPRRERS
ncbi:MAG TPA: prolipoprotein diacylglyceryl transferase [Firmicutes bacterium]|nr:prolipoprotein diacylglyceryl transferase [Bacillota bacterium]